MTFKKKEVIEEEETIVEEEETIVEIKVNKCVCGGNRLNSCSNCN